MPCIGPLHRPRGGPKPDFDFAYLSHPPTSGSIESLKKSRYSATLLLSIFANIDKSNVAVERLFLKLSMDPLVGNDSPISKF